MPTLLFDGSLPVPPFPDDGAPLGPNGQFLVLLVLCGLLVAAFYFFFEIASESMDSDSEFWRDWKRWEPRPWVKRLRVRRAEKKWWQL